MLNYRKIVHWHRTHQEEEEAAPGRAATETEIEAQLQRQYIEKKLEAGLGRIWQDVQTKVRVLVQASHLAELSIDQFIVFLDNIHTLIEVGREFSGSPSETLQASLQKLCLSYFQEILRTERLGMISFKLLAGSI